MREFQSQRVKEILKTLMRKKGLTYADLAAELECSVPTVTRILGSEEITLSRLLQICGFLEIDLADLATLMGENTDQEEKFTPAQEQFLARNKNFFAYLVRLFSGDSPRKIAADFGLTARSTEKYLIGLEKHDLIRVSARQRVRPAFKSLPRLGSGPLGRAYYEALIRNGAQFFIDVAREGLRSETAGKSPGSRYGIHSVKVSRATFEAWEAELEKAHRNFERLASFEEKTKDPAELMTAVIIHGRTLVKNEDPALRHLENTLGVITNFA